MNLTQKEAWRLESEGVPIERTVGAGDWQDSMEALEQGMTIDDRTQWRTKPGGKVRCMQVCIDPSPSTGFICPLTEKGLADIYEHMSDTDIGDTTYINHIEMACEDYINLPEFEGF